MPSSYLATADLATYGLPASMGAATIAQASTAINFIIGRPEGLAWVADARGMPCHMAALSPSMTFTLSAPVQPGTGVVAAIQPAIATQDMVGDVLVLERGTTNVEACIVQAVTDAGTLVLATVVSAHAAQATLDQGCLITEERALPAQRSIARVARTPLVRVVSLQGRYGYGRRSDQVSGLFQDINLLASVQSFGGPPLWVGIDPAQASISPSTGEIWVPAGMLVATFSDVRIRYVAGYAAANIPAPVKMATAQIASSIVALADMPGNARSVRAGDTQIVRDAASYLDADSRAMLAPFAARAFF